MHINKKRISDNQFREAKVERHPDFEPFLVFHAKPSGKLYFKSTYNEDKTAQTLARRFPHLYYWPEKPENKIIELPIGGHARLPHSKFTVHSTDNSPCSYTIRAESDL